MPEQPNTTEHFTTDLPRDLAALHQLCVSHSDELRTLSNERGVQQVMALLYYAACLIAVVDYIFRSGSGPVSWQSIITE